MNEPARTWAGRRDSLGCRDASRVADLAPHSGKAVFQQQLFLFHAVQFIVVQRQYAEFRIPDFAVQFLVILIKAAELGIRLHHGVYVVFLLVFEHGAASSCAGNA